ncbi:MAG: restriction endonuclease subunit S [Paludibacteraceae bacterium]|nr:restriction endonuclease subunit S [Paludibacteraceae bacterium]
MKHDWKQHIFSNVFDLQMGKTPDRKSPELFEGDNVWVTISDLDGVNISSSKEHISDEAASKIKIVKKGTVIMSFKLSVGKAAIASKDLYTNEAIMAFNVNDGYDINNKFLYYYLSGYNWEGGNRAVMGVTLNKATISKQIISLPPLPTQQSIVSELDSLSKIIADCKETLKDYDALEQSIFYDMFGDPVKNEKGWEVKKLGEISNIKTGPFGSLLHKNDYISGGIPLVNPIHMRNFQIVPSNDLTISNDKANELREFILKTNDVVLARRGDIGRCAIVSEKEDGFLCGTGSLFVRFKESMSSVFTMFVVRSESFVKHLQSRSKGATMQNLNTTTVSNLEIILPPLPLQQQFASKIEAIERMKVETKKALQEAETLFQARMDYWFG